MSRSRALKIALPTAAALVAGGAVALAAIPAADGTIHGCYATGGTPTGALRIVDEGVNCGAGETAISWNQRGPVGPAGPAGATGPTGDTGPAGSSDSGSGGSGGTDTGSTTTQAGGPSADIFLKLDGIAGESTDDKHKGEIDIEAFTFNAKQGGAASGSGGGSGKVKFAPLRFVKVYDASSPKLFQAAASGRHIKSAVLTFRRSGDAGDLEFLTYKLSDVVVSSYQQGGADVDRRALGSLEDEVGLSPAKVQVTEKTTTASGDSGPAVSASWDLKHHHP
jgi:type VI secretion system secreted protein Hcp